MIETIIEKNEMNEQSEMEEFRRDLIEKIERKRDLFFSYADSYNERKDNDEVRQKEKRGDLSFDYKEPIFILLEKLSLMNKEERSKIIWSVKNGIDYTINGVYVYGLKDNSRGVVAAPLFADFVNNPSRYL